MLRLGLRMGKGQLRTSEDITGHYPFGEYRRGWTRKKAPDCVRRLEGLARCGQASFEKLRKGLICSPRWGLLRNRDGLSRTCGQPGPRACWRQPRHSARAT